MIFEIELQIKYTLKQTKWRNKLINELQLLPTMWGGGVGGGEGALKPSLDIPKLNNLGFFFHIL